MSQLTALLEAALFAASRPLSLAELRRLERDAGKQEILEALEALRRDFREGGRGVELVEVGEGYQILTRPEYAEAILQAQIVSRPRRLSPAAMETLAIIAYRQPVARSEIEEIRGVGVESVLRSLQERGLVDTRRGEGMGRPLLYSTTPAMLELLGITSLDELPRLEELSVALTPARPPEVVGEGEESEPEAGEGGGDAPEDDEAERKIEA